MSTALPTVTDLRALEVFTEVPAGCRLHLIRCERHWPHLRPGEWAVIDPADREFVSGELYQVAFKSGPVDQRLTIQHAVFRADMGNGVWFCPLNKPRTVAEAHRRLAAGTALVSDGPVRVERLGEYITGRVVGLFGPALGRH